eukprot:gene17640-27149_t
MSACLPKRWAHLQPYGAQVEGTAFVPCKVPLDKRFDRSYAKPADRFELIEFLDRLENELGKKILAVVDLTQTDRYYEKNHLLARGIQHVKFWGVKGHDTIPAEGFVTQFIRVTSEIEKQNPDVKMISKTDDFLIPVQSFTRMRRRKMSLGGQLFA